MGNDDLNSWAQRKALIRADGSKAIGMGHLNRACLVTDSLAARGYEVCLLVKKNPDAETFFESKSIQPEFLPQYIPLQSELDIMYRTLDSTSDILVLDVLNYSHYDNLIHELRRTRCISAIIFDGEETERIEADVALNGSPAQSPVSPLNNSCYYLIGPKFFIMDPRYEGLIVPPPKRPIRNVFVMVGGSDHHNLLFKLLRTFNRYSNEYSIIIASTSTTGYIEDLREWAESANFPIALFIDTDSLVPYWSRADIAITAGGNTLFERISTRLPGATLCQLLTQMRHANSFERLGVNVNLGYGPEVDQNELNDKVDRFLIDSSEHNRQHNNAAGLVNANGLKFFIDAMEEKVGNRRNEI